MQPWRPTRGRCSTKGLQHGHPKRVDLDLIWPPRRTVPWGTTPGPGLHVAHIETDAEEPSVWAIPRTRAFSARRWGVLVCVDRWGSRLCRRRRRRRLPASRCVPHAPPPPRPLVQRSGHTHTHTHTPTRARTRPCVSHQRHPPPSRGGPNLHSPPLHQHLYHRG